MHRGAAHESAVKLSPEDPPSLRGYLGYLAMDSDRSIRFRYLGELPAKLGSVRFDAYRCLKVLFFFKVGFTSNIISNRYNLSLLGDPKFAQRGVSGARRATGGSLGRSQCTGGVECQKKSIEGRGVQQVVALCAQHD